MQCAVKVLLTFQRVKATRKLSAEDRRGGADWLLQAPRQRTVPLNDAGRIHQHSCSHETARNQLLYAVSFSLEKKYPREYHISK